MWNFAAVEVVCPAVNALDLTIDDEDSEEETPDPVDWRELSHADGTPPTVEEFAFFCLLTGMTVGKMMFGSVFLHVKAPSTYHISKALERIEAALLDAQEESTSRAADESGPTVHAMGDSCWAVRGFKSPMGTTVFLSVKTKQVIGVAVKINATKRYKNYEGSARSMEGAGTLDICKDLKDKGLPECAEQQCINHWAKNISQKVGLSIHKDYQSSIRAWVWNSARLACQEQDPAKFLVQRLEICVRHHNDDHSQCIHTRKYSEKDVMKKEQVLVLSSILRPYCANASSYAHGLNQSLVESFNHELSSISPKDVPVASMYRSRVALAVLSHNEGLEVALPALFAKLGIPMSSFVLLALLKRSKRKQADSQRYQAKEKFARQGRKEKTYVKTDHTYKESTRCGCSSKAACSTLMCTCKANKNECGDVCGCGQLCHNKATIETSVQSNLDQCLLLLHTTASPPTTATASPTTKRRAVLVKLNVQELKAACKQNGIRGYSQLKKAFLIDRLMAIEAEEDNATSEIYTVEEPIIQAD